MAKNNIGTPLHFILVNHNQIRITALGVSILSVAFLFTGSWILPALLVLDFACRAFHLKYSLLNGLSSVVVEILDVEAMPVNQVPKNFIARLGLTASCLIAGLLAVDLNTVANILCTLLALLSFAEFTTTVGIDYHLYFLYTKLFTKKKLIN